jgi:hypothetical protein
MEIKVERLPSHNGWTQGHLSIDGAFVCFTCEDEIREVAGQPVEKWKVYGQTAIPAGRYRVIVDHSDHFQRDLPHILDVPGYTGVRIHVGNFAKDTDGCLLPGENTCETGVTHSTSAFARVFGYIANALARSEEVWITFVNPAAPLVTT